ncbi:hypothetical protein [Robertmurraya kyonggiensis]|uniref:hypothetical protein n=1 Tax=Robertmurraya kyonggiensis TaxID=1037680 RepID=UPI00130E0E75|nr:hypothetical protein [Robertmurraya kyonggiensis]
MNCLIEKKLWREKLGFAQTFAAEIDGEPVHYELVLDGFKVGIATKESTKKVHGLSP